MYVITKWRWLIMPILVLLFGIVISLAVPNDSMTCMGVQILSENDRSAYTEYVYYDFSNYLLHNGAKAATDVNSSTVYISQDIQADTQLSDLTGTLKVALPQYQLYFVESPDFDDLAAAVLGGKSFQLIITDGTQTYMQYDVVFTTLPVICMEGAFSYVDDEGRDVLSGGLCLWTPNDPGSGRYSVKTSNVQWHIRGDTTAGMEKKSWKLSLKDSQGENQNVALLGLGSDDDWILNAMSLDDTCLKEKLVMDLWNEWAAQTSWNVKMSTGEYVEAVVNGEYVGLYLLQRRVDAKYLELGNQDILLKGNSTWQATTPQEGFEIVASALSEADTYALIEGAWSGEVGVMVHVSNFVDVNLFLQFGSLVDNTGYKNMFYLMRWEGEDYTLYLIPWDTDMSFGVVWIDGFTYHYEASMAFVALRQEFSMVQEMYSDLNDRMAKRWDGLREGVLSNENIFSVLTRLEEQLISAGALARDQQRWGQYYSGADTAQMLYRFVEEKLKQMDEYYA